MTSVIRAAVNAVHDHEGEVTGLVQPTRSRTQTLVSQDGTRLLALDGWVVMQVEVDEHGARTVHVLTADETAAA